MLAKIHIVISIVKQIISFLENRFPSVDRTSQTRNIDMDKNFNFTTISYSCVATGKQICIFSLFSVGSRWRVLMGSLLTKIHLFPL